MDQIFAPHNISPDGRQPPTWIFDQRAYCQICPNFAGFLVFHKLSVTVVNHANAVGIGALHRADDLSDLSDGQGMSKGIAFGPLYRHHPGGGFDRAGNPRYIRPAIPPELYLLVSDSHFRQGAHLRPNSDDALERIVGCTNR